MATLLNDRDKILQAAAFRSKTTGVTIASTSSGFKTAKNGGTTLALGTSATSITLTATANSVFTIDAGYTWEYALSDTPTTWVYLGSDLSIEIINSDFLSYIGSSTQIQVRCTVSEIFLDTAYGFFTLTYTVESSDPIIANLTRTSAVLTTDASGFINSFANTDTTITVTRAGIAFAYSETPIPNGFKVEIDLTQAGGRTVGSTSNTSASWTLSGITALASTTDSAKVAFIITVYDARGVAISPTIGAQIVYNKVTPATTVVANGKFVTLTAYGWSNTGSAPAYTQVFFYNWTAGTTSAYPTGYYYYAPISPGAGYTLYQLTLSVSDINTATNTYSNWANATVNTIGYRLNGTIGPRSQYYRTCYIVTTTGTAPATPTAAIGDTAPVNWSFVPAANLTTGQYMYQSDGILTGVPKDTSNTSSIAWTAPYLSNLKVGSLSAISADMGTITAGNLNIGPIGTTDYKFVINNDGTLRIKNARDGARMLIKNNFIKVFDTAGNLRVHLGDLSDASTN